MGASTKAVGNAIVSILSDLSVYTLAQLEQIKDVTDLIANGGACAEVYCNMDAERKLFGGGKWDEQTWYILSMCGLETAARAAAIYDIRDAMVTALSSHTALGGTIPGLFYAQFKRPEGGRFLRIDRGKEYQAHAIELETKVAYQVTLVP